MAASRPPEKSLVRRQLKPSDFCRGNLCIKLEYGIETAEEVVVGRTGLGKRLFHERMRSDKID